MASICQQYDVSLIFRGSSSVYTILLKSLLTPCSVTATVALEHSCAMKSLILVPRVALQNFLNSTFFATSIAATRMPRHFLASFVL